MSTATLIRERKPVIPAGFQFQRFRPPSSQQGAWWLGKAGRFAVGEVAESSPASGVHRWEEERH